MDNEALRKACRAARELLYYSHTILSAVHSQDSEGNSFHAGEVRDILTAIGQSLSKPHAGARPLSELDPDPDHEQSVNAVADALRYANRDQPDVTISCVRDVTAHGASVILATTIYYAARNAVIELSRGISEIDNPALYPAMVGGPDWERTWFKNEKVFGTEGEIYNEHPTYSMDQVFLPARWESVRRALLQIETFDYPLWSTSIGKEMDRALAVAVTSPTPEFPENPNDWILISEAASRLQFIKGDGEGLRKWAAENPGKIRLRPDPKHRRRHQAYAADVYALEREHDRKTNEAMDKPQPELPPISDAAVIKMVKRVVGQPTKGKE